MNEPSWSNHGLWSALSITHHCLTSGGLSLCVTWNDQVSRRMLEVSLELGFPVSILERSPLVLRDLELVKQINQRAPSVVFFNLISAPNSPAYER